MDSFLILGAPGTLLQEVPIEDSGKDRIHSYHVDVETVLVNWQQYSAVIIFCENTDSWKKITRNSDILPGIPTAQHLRKSGISIPILFLSFLTRPQILDLKPSASIITAVGSHFLRLPATPTQIADALKDTKPLSALELQDVQLFHTDNEGALAELLHSLSGGKLAAFIQQGNTHAAIEALVTVLRQAYALYQTDHTTAEKTLREEIVALLKERNETTLTEPLLLQATEKVRALCRWLASTFKPTEDDSPLGPAQPEKKPWKVLVLDDELDEGATLIQELVPHVAEVIYCNNAEAALQALRSEKSGRNMIPVILCDYRLLMQAEDGVTVQQPIQGYSFLNQVAEEFDNRIIQAVIYSGMPRRFLLRSVRQLRLRCEPVSKIEHRLEDPIARRYIIDTLLSLGDEAYEAMLALPLSASSVWKAQYHRLYIQHRATPGYEARELHIRAYCTRWAAQYLADKSAPPPSPFVSFTDPSTKLKDLSDPFTAKYLDELLKGRRLAVWLYLRQNDLLTIGKMLRKPVKKDAPPDKTYTTFLSQALALSLSDYPFGLTIEELNWLQYDMGIPALDAYRPLRSALLHTEEMIAAFLATSEDLQARLKLLTEDGKG